MSAHDLAIQLQSLFEEYRVSTSLGRKPIYPRIESLCQSIISTGVTPYVGQCCSRARESCKQMARQRQPKTYSDSSMISQAFGEISSIEKALRE